MPTLSVLSEITVNLLRPNSNTVVYAKQYDKASRIININLISGDSVWDPPTSGINYIVSYAKPDGTMGMYDRLEDGTTAAVTRISSGKIKLTLAEQALTAFGNTLVQVVIYNANERLTTLSFVVNVEKSTPTDEEIQSDSYFNVIYDKIASLSGAVAHPPYINSNTYNWMIWSESDNAMVDSGYTALGADVLSTVTMYQAGNSGTTIPTGAWSSTIPELNQGQYLWTRIVTSFSGGKINTSYHVSYNAIDGSIAVDVSTTYQISNNVIDPPTGEWSSSFPILSQGDFLWIRTILTFNDGTTSTSYQVSYIGIDGSISVIAETTYAEGENGTIAPESGWSSNIPVVTPGKFLWTKTVLTFNDGTISTSYQVARSGIDGSGSVSSVNGIAPDLNGNVSTIFTILIPSFSSLPLTVTNSAITANHVVLEYVLGNPSAQVDDWSINIDSGSLTINGNISGETTLNLVLGAASIA